MKTATLERSATEPRLDATNPNAQTALDLDKRRILLFSSKMSPQTDATRRGLNKAPSVSYEELDVSDDPQEAERKENEKNRALLQEIIGKITTPTVVLLGSTADDGDGANVLDAWFGYRPDKIKALRERAI